MQLSLPQVRYWRKWLFVQCCVEASSFVFRLSNFDLSIFTFPVKLINLVTLNLVVIIKHCWKSAYLTATEAGSHEGKGDRHFIYLFFTHVKVTDILFIFYSCLFLKCFTCYDLLTVFYV